jgi:hypothetical protein
MYLTLIQKLLPLVPVAGAVPQMAVIALQVIQAVKAQHPDMTWEQILDKADANFSKNEIELLKDLARLGG